MYISQQNHENRKFDRVPLALDVNLLLAQDGQPTEVEVTLEDLSLGGLRIQSDGELNLQKSQPVEISTDNCPPIEAEVRWGGRGVYGLVITQQPERVARTWIGQLLQIQGLSIEDFLPAGPRLGP